MVKPDESRRVYLYLPSKEDTHRWGDFANEAGLPLSKFVIEIVENALADEEDFKPRGEMVKEIGFLRKENKGLSLFCVGRSWIRTYRLNGINTRMS